MDSKRIKQIIILAAIAGGIVGLITAFMPRPASLDEPAPPGLAAPR
jgi:hypothetical protein